MPDEVPVRDQPDDDGAFARVVTELRQWHVFRFAATFAVVAWLIVQIVATVGPAFELPVWVLRAVVLASIVGFLAAMSFLLFRPRRAKTGRAPVYLSRRARLSAGLGVLFIAAIGAALSIRSLSAPEPVSLAVLPFADLSPGRDKAYFAEGVAEEILSSLAAEKGIKVLGRTSARQIERNPDPQAIRASFGVTHLLEGSARTAGDSLRVNVRLIDTADGSQLWEEEYDGAIGDVFSVQDRIAGTVMKRLRGTLLGRVEKTATTGIDAYQTYLAARALMRDRKEEPLSQALELAKKVIAADPKYAPGHALYAELLYMLSDDALAYGKLPLEKIRPTAVRHAREAVRLAPDKAEGYAALGLIQRGAEGVTSLQRAIKLDPARAELRIWLGIALNTLSRHDEAFDQFIAAAETEPLWPLAAYRQVLALAAAGRIAEAEAAVAKFRQRGGPEAQVFRLMATVARAKGDVSGTIKAMRAQIAADPALPKQGEFLAREYALLGMTKEALELFPVENVYDRMLVAGQRAELRQLMVADGAKSWDRPATDMGMFGVATVRDWPTFMRAYRGRPASYADFCNLAPQLAPSVIIGLRETGAGEEARELLECSWRRTEREMAMKNSASGSWPGRLPFFRASLLALRGDAATLDWLGKAVDRGWNGLYFSSRLADWAQFDRFRADPRYAALQKRIDANIARERAELRAGR